MFAVIIWQSDLCGGEHRVLIQTEHCICGDGVVGQETTAYHLVGFEKHTKTHLRKM